MMVWLIILGIIVLSAFLILWIISWCVHRSMNIDDNKPYDYVRFKTFVREFDKYRDDPELVLYHNNNSIFLDKNRQEILYLHADIVRINGKCMIFYPLDYIKYKIWMRKVNGSRRVKGLWKVEEN